MQEAFKIFILSTIAITFWTAFLLFQDKRGIKSLNRWFAVFLLALTTPLMEIYTAFIVPGGIPQLTLVAFTFLWLKGPFIWTFLKVLTHVDLTLKNTWFHFLPWFLVLIAIFIFPQAIGTFMLIGMGHMLGYLFFSLRRLVNKRRYIAEIWQGFQNTAYYWLLYVILGLMMLVAVDFVVMSLVELDTLKTYNLLDYLAFPIFSVYVLSIGVLCVYRPELLFRAMPESMSSNEIIDVSINIKSSRSIAALDIDLQQTTDQKERHLELDVALAQSLMQQLTQLMQEDQIYRQNELTMPDLAQTLGISVHQISELLNVHQEMSFYEYINDYRLKYACGLLCDVNCHLRILDIAFEAGFNNKNSFYRTFKENLGVTPNQYRSEALSLKATEILSVV